MSLIGQKLDGLSAKILNVLISFTFPHFKSSQIQTRT